jgi:futalosine hydrolase
MTSWLILVPTAVELQHLPQHFLKMIERKGGAIELCGFGPVVAAARAASLTMGHQPQQVVLCGVAGAIGESLRVSSAYRFDSVACYGIGVGCGQHFRSASSVGWRQWSGDASTGDSSGQALSLPIGDVLELSKLNKPSEQKLLLTTCAASQDESDVELKRAAFPRALAEDMEGFAVAAACQLAGLSLSIVRGISNRAGDRDHRNWKIAEAMQAAAALVEEMIEL